MENLKLFRINKISDRITRIFGVSGEIMYLVTGDNKAALIDSGVGVGNLKELIENLTDKPIMVILTHGHVDHVMGAGAFDEVYLNEQDQELYMQHLTEDMRQFHIDMSLGEQAKLIDKNDYIAIRKADCKPLYMGHIFDLGGISLEICEGAGHTKGMLTVLVREERALILGDACNCFTFMFLPESTNIEDYKSIMTRLNHKVEGKYDSVLLSHASGNAPTNMISEIIKVCDDILNENTDDEPFEFQGKVAFIAKAVDEEHNRIDGGIGNIIYRK